MPTADLPSMAVTIRPRQMDSEKLAKLLRAGEPAVMGRVQDDRLLLDMRTVSPGEGELLVKAVAAALKPTIEPLRSTGSSVDPPMSSSGCSPSCLPGTPGPRERSPAGPQWSRWIRCVPTAGSCWPHQPISKREQGF